MKKLTIIFDLDGTLLNTDELIFKSFEHVFQNYFPGHKLSKDELLSFLGPSLVESFSKYSDNVDELIDCYKEYNHKHHKTYVAIYPHVKETLEYLKDNGYSIVVLTSKTKSGAYLGLDMFDLSQYIDFVIGVDDVKNAKPHPEGIFKALSMTNNKNGVMIGDNKTDIKAGKNADIYTIGVKWSPKGYKEMEELIPDLLIDDMSEIIEYIEKVEKLC
jgi:pyrophosphatase PpaX